MAIRSLNRSRGPSRTEEELHGPFGHAHVLHVAIVSWIGLGDVLDLANKRERFLRPLGILGECERFGISRKWIVIVAAVLYVSLSLIHIYSVEVKGVARS